MEIPVRTMFLKIIEWYIGTNTDFKVSFGKGGRNMTHYISSDLYHRILSTYADSNVDNIWNSLFLMADLFDDLANKIAKSMSFNYKATEAKNVTEYLKSIHAASIEK